MQATLQFELPDEQYEFDQAVNGHKYASVLWHLDQHLRNRLKYEEGLSQDAYDALQHTRDHLRQLTQEANLDLG